MSIEVVWRLVHPIDRPILWKYDLMVDEERVFIRRRSLLLQ